MAIDKIHEMEYISSFHCLSENCPYTCCMGMDIEIDNESLSYFKKLPNKIQNMINENSSIIDGTVYFRNANNYCLLLTPSGLCKLQIEGGEEALCYTCREYPRIPVSFEGRQYKTLSLSCPMACSLIMQFPLIKYYMFNQNQMNIINEVIEKTEPLTIFANDISVIEKKLHFSNTFPLNDHPLFSFNEKIVIRELFSYEELENLAGYFMLKYNSYEGIRWDSVMFGILFLTSYYRLIYVEYSMYILISIISREIEHSDYNLKQMNNILQSIMDI